MSGSAVDAGRAGLAIEAIEPRSPPPVGAPARAVVVGGARWVDGNGPGAVYLLEVASIDRRSIAIYARSLAGDDRRLVREVKDRADACPERNLTGFVPPAVSITDADADGTAEVGFGYLLGCAGGAVVAKQVLLEGDAKYIVRGSAPDAGAAEPPADAWPANAFALADAAFRENAGALDVADAVGAGGGGAGGDRAIYDRDTHFDDVEVNRTSGDVEIELSYPKLPMLARSEAGDLTTRMREFLDVDARHGRQLIGNHTGSCEVELIAPEVASVSCQVMVDVRTHAEQNAGTGGSPAGPTVVGFTIWRTPGHEAVTLAELGLPPSECPWALERDGLVRLRSEDGFAPCSEEHVAWSELHPTTDRARALVAAMQP